MSGRAAAPRAGRDRGSAVVGGIVVMFALTTGAFIWLARDVDRAIGARADAQSIAFQAARAGAQHLDEGALRSGTVEIDPVAATDAATHAGRRLLAAYGSVGRVSAVDVEGDAISVEVTIDDGGRTVAGVATVRARRGVSSPRDGAG